MSTAMRIYADARIVDDTDTVRGCDATCPHGHAGSHRGADSLALRRGLRRDNRDSGAARLVQQGLRTPVGRLVDNGRAGVRRLEQRAGAGRSQAWTAIFSAGAAAKLLRGQLNRRS